MSRQSALLDDRDDASSYRGYPDDDTHRTSSFGPSSSLTSTATAFYHQPRRAILIALAVAAVVVLLIIIVAAAASRGTSGNDTPPAGPTMTTLGGMTAYVMGSASNPILLYLPDVNGVNGDSNANMALAASYASAGFYVWVLDYFDGTNGFAPNSWTIDNSTARTRMAVAEVRQKMPGRSIFSTGYCWGGGVGVQLTYADASMPSVGDAMVDVSVVAHAAQVSVARYAMTVSPLFAVMPQNDAGFNNNAGAYINTITCSGCRGREAMFKVYPGVSHGFAVTANISDSNAVLQKQAAFDDTVAFFNAHLPTSVSLAPAPARSRRTSRMGRHEHAATIGHRQQASSSTSCDINGPWYSAQPGRPGHCLRHSQGSTVFMPDYFFG